MISPKSIPFEVFVQIFEYLKKRDIYNCITICKAWNDAAIQSFYSKGLIINSRNVDFLQLKSSSLKNTNQQEDQKFMLGQTTYDLSIRRT